MSLSPPKEGVEPGDATPEHSESMERGEEAQVREAYEFEVKEQDRWLPIANGWSRSIPHAFPSTELARFRLATLHDDGISYCRRFSNSYARKIVGFLLHSLKIGASILFL